MGAVDTTYTFTATDTITSAKMNNIIDQTTITTDAIIGTTLDVASGKLKIRSAGITSNEMGANSVTTTSIADSSVTPGKLSQPLTLATEKATTSGTIVEFTGIPSWVKRITMILNAVSTNGSNNLELQIGNGSYSTSGYDTLCSYVGGAGSSVVDFNGGFGIIVSGSTASLCYGRYTLDLIGGNKYIGSGVFHVHQVGVVQYTMQSAGASPVLSGPMDRIRISVVGGANTFDAGSINIMYE